MSYAARETSPHGANPFELYAFEIADDGWFFTSGDTPQSYLGHTFEVETIHRTAISQSGEAKGGQIKITVPVANPVALQFRTYLPDTPMSIVIYRTHGTDGEFAAIFTGRVLAATFGDFAEITAMPENDVLKYAIPSEQFQTQCNHFLFDAGCKVAKGPFSVAATVSAISGDRTQLTIPVCGTKPSGWFDAGYIEFGLQRRMILAHVGTVVNLKEPVPGLDVGASVTVYAGCMRNFGTCVSKFNNAKNFAGFQWIPTRNPFATPFA
jgi:uncharacterized phage protein (TIGR02218 family)